MISWLWLVPAFVIGLLLAPVPGFGWVWIWFWEGIDALVHPVAFLGRHGVLWARRKTYARLMRQKAERNRRWEERDHEAFTGRKG